MDFVDKQHGLLVLLDFLHDLFQPLLEITAIAGARQQGAHVEGIDCDALQHFGHFVPLDHQSEAFGNRRLADTGITDEKRVVLLAAAQHLNRAGHLGRAADQRINAAFQCFFVEIDAISIQRIRFFAALAFAVTLVGPARLVIRPVRVDTARRAVLACHHAFGDPVRDVIDRIIAGHILLLQEIGGMALALGKNRHQDIGARHLVTARRLDMDHRALDDALETGCRLCIVSIMRDQRQQFLVDIMGQIALQQGNIDPAGAHDGCRIGIIGQGHQQMLERGKFVMILVGQSQSPMQGLFQTTREGRHEPESLLRFFHHALQRMLMFAREIHHHRHFGFCDLVSIDAAETDTVLMHMQHDFRRFFYCFIEETLQDTHHELHGSIVVIEQKHTVKARFFGSRAGQYRGARIPVRCPHRPRRGHSNSIRQRHLQGILQGSAS